MHHLNAWHSAQGLKTLVGAIRQAPIEPGMPVPPIMLVAPPKLEKAKGTITTKLEGAEKKAVGLSAAIEAIAEECGCYFFDAGSVTPTSRVDGVHLDEDQHHTLGVALAEAIRFLVA